METQSNLTFYENQVKQLDVDINRNCTSEASTESTQGRKAVVPSLYGLIKDIQMERDQPASSLRKQSPKQKPVTPPKPTKTQSKPSAPKAVPPPIKPKPVRHAKSTEAPPMVTEDISPSATTPTESKQIPVIETVAESPTEPEQISQTEFNITAVPERLNEPMEPELISPPESFMPSTGELPAELEAIPPPDAFADTLVQQLTESNPIREQPSSLELPVVLLTEEKQTMDSDINTEPMHRLRKSLSVDCLALSTVEPSETKQILEPSHSVMYPEIVSTKPKQILEPRTSLEPVQNLKKALSVDCLSTSSGHGSLQSPPEPRPPKPRRKATSRRKLSVKPEEISENSSLESGISYSSAITTSSNQSRSPEQTRSHIRKQRASRESLNKFIEKHTKVGLTKSLPAQLLTASKVNPYPEEWTRKKQYLSIQKRHNLRDLKYDSAGNIILTTKSSVQLYDNNGVFQEKLYTNRVAEPWGLYVNHENGNVLVSDNDENCVKEFNGLGIIVQEYGPVPGPRGVAVTSAGYVFVCSDTDSCVYVFDRRAQLITVIGQGVLSAPTYIALHRNTILVSDESRIIGFNVESEIEYVYGRADGSRHPACLCIDNQTGFVLATSYYKDKLIAFNQKMERAVKVKQSSRPILCAISPYGHLLIVENNSNGTLLKMFRMK